MTFPIVAGVEFRTHKDFPLYCVGSDGSIWSRLGMGRQPTRENWHTVTGAIAPDGYRVFRLKGRSKWRTIRGHKLVLEAFVGAAPAGCECCHKNHVRLDNRIDNIRWGTRQQNVRERDEAGRTPCGSSHYRSKLNEEMVREIRRRKLAGETEYAIADAFGISRRAVSCIVRRENWKHI